MIIPYKEYITDFAKNNAKLNNEEKIGLKHAHEEADKFLKESSGVVNYLVKEFEMKKMLNYTLEQLFQKQVLLTH